MKSEILIMVIVLISLCAQPFPGQITTTQQNLSRTIPANIQDAVNSCREQCFLLKNLTDTSNGPCILNEISNFQGWVCDMVHEPRQEIDNLPTNQCPNYRDGFATNFIELDTNCNYLRSQ